MRKFITHTDRVHHVHLPRVLIETAVLHGAPREALFENTDITPEMLTNPDMRVSFTEYGMLSANALRLTGNPALGIHVGRNTGVAQMGVVGFALMNSPTLGAALELGIRYSGCLLPGWDFGMKVEGDVGTFTITPTIPMGRLTVFAHEFVLAAFDTQGRALSGHALPIHSIHLPYPEPAHSHEYRERLYDVPFYFDQPVARVDFDARALRETVAFADPAAAKLAEQYCAQAMPATASHDGVVEQVRRLLANTPGTPPSLESVARSLQTSTRTLRRELMSMNSSYKELLDESRRARAEQWMKTNSMPLDHLATKLGFSHVRSFRRAFKRWTGHTPSETRVRA
jgi:AraC-like DNA-binding protein